MKILIQNMLGLILGNIYLKLKNLRKSVESFEFAIAIDDEYSSAYTNLGEAYLKTENYESSKKSFLKVFRT